MMMIMMMTLTMKIIDDHYVDDDDDDNDSFDIYHWIYCKGAIYMKRKMVSVDDKINHSFSHLRLKWDPWDLAVPLALRDPQELWDSLALVVTPEIRDRSDNAVLAEQ